jgi:hypothetical protein
MSLNLGAATIQTTASSDGSTTENVSFAGSGLQFANTFTGVVTQAYKNCVLSAEQDLASHWSNNITLNVQFEEQAQGQSGDLASNSWFFDNVSYTALKGALASLSTTENNTLLQKAVASLPSADPTGGAGFDLPEAYAHMLGLYSGTENPDTITLNTSYGWSFGQDVTSTLEHEISEGAMGRVGGLGDQNSVWDTMDLFRFNVSGQRDYTDGRDGKATYFSYDGGAHLIARNGFAATVPDISYNNEYNSNGTFNNNGDTADFIQQDVFGTGSPGETTVLSPIDVDMMDVLGWDPNPRRTVRAPDDFNGDNQSDILWRNANGDTAVWNSTGAGGFTGQDLGNIGNGWQVAGVGYFNSDSDADILWSNTNGDTAIWNSNGSGGFAGQDLGTAGSGWQVAGVGDFNGDGEADILWSNASGDTAIWKSNGSGGFAAQDLATAGSGWKVAGVGDFNGDGEADILWSNASGDAAIWKSNGSGGFAAQDLGIAGSGWQAAGVGDFNGDGKADILWSNASGDTAIWNSNGSGGFTGQDLGTAGSGWQVAGVGDFNGDGKADILWRNAGGDTVIWDSNGSGGFAGHDLGTVAGGWKVQAA